MSIIIITTKKTQWSAAALLEFKRITHSALSQIQSALTTHLPIFKRELFLNDHNAVAWQLRQIIRLDHDHALLLQYYSVDASTSLAHEPIRISTDILENILTAADGEYEDTL